MGNIQIKKYEKVDFNTGTWSGGTTTQLAIYPRHTQYGERNFLWRLSSATVEVEESDFTALPDYDRVLVVLDGEVVLAHKDIRAIRLAKYEQDRFSGGYETKSYGKITDFNLMVRKGNEGFVECLEVSSDYMEVKPQSFETLSRSSQTFYCAEGFCTLTINDELVMLRAGELLVATGDASDFEKLGIMGEGRTIWSHVYFNEDEELCGAEPEGFEEAQKAEVKESVDVASATSTATETAASTAKPAPKVKEKQPPITFEDVKWTTIVSLSNFRGGKKLFKCLKGTWYDRALQKGINKLDCIFLPFIVCMAGVMAVAFYGVEHWTNSVMFAGIMAWVLLDIFVVSPLMYLLVLPRPVKSHIKKIDELEGDDKEYYDFQMGRNETAEKILKKYEITGRNKYID